MQASIFRIIIFGAAVALWLTMQGSSGRAAPPAYPAFPGIVSDYHGYMCHDFTVDGCAAKVVEPKQAAPGRPWIWRAMFWDAFPAADLALLHKGFHLAYIEVGDTFGAPAAIKHWDPFYDVLIKTYGLGKYPALEGLSRGGLYIYRWAAQNPDKVGCIYGDAPVCDIKIWPRGSAAYDGNDRDWAQIMQSYHFNSLTDALAYSGNPLDDSTLIPLAKAHVPIIHVIGDADPAVVPIQNTEVLRARYLALGGPFFEVVKHGCGHHPHGLSDPTVVVDFLAAHTVRPQAARTPADRSGEVLTLQPAQWQ